MKNIDAIKRAKFKKIYDKERRCMKAEEDGKIERIQNDAAREKMRALKEREKQAKSQINCPMCKTHTCITCRIKIQRLCKIIPAVAPFVPVLQPVAAVIGALK